MKYTNKLNCEFGFMLFSQTLSYNITKHEIADFS